MGLADMFAHSSSDFPWEPLDVHLTAVAKCALGFGEAFGAGQLCHLAGLWHDLGKGSVAFQQKVLHAGGDESVTDAEVDGSAYTKSTGGSHRVDHSTAGAQHASRVAPQPWGDLLAYIIAGHHGRLADWSTPGSDAVLPKRLKKKIEPWQAPASIPLQVSTTFQLLPTGFRVHPDSRLYSFQVALMTRMVYAALVDADRLETERYCAPQMAALRPVGGSSPRLLLEQLDTFIANLRHSRRADSAPVDHSRDVVLKACRQKALMPAGIFSLTVPTGGGKTLASMAFALTHAAEHGLRRVVYALPFTSIIEQTAATFCQVFSRPEDVLEHHSNFDPNVVYQRTRSRIAYEMAAENFDAPIIVTTNVQLFESLFSCHGSTCRKLHRLAGSVIVLDEAQAIPPRLLRPTLAVLDELVRNYHCSIVLCTATQPAVTRRDEFPIGLEKVTPIIDQPDELYQQMKRVAVHKLTGKMADSVLVERLLEHPSVLCIVNTRKHAAELMRLLIDVGDSTAIHLSAAMCPAHRSECVRKMKFRLAEGQPCRVISTQVIEAGVDVDFPVVYRALAGFDSIAQAAGRCNREGQKKQGDVYVFETEHRPAISLFDTVAAAKALYSDYPDPLELDAIEAYFRRVYWSENSKGAKPWDAQDVMGCFQMYTDHGQPVLDFNFRQADQRFRWIDSNTTSVIVPYGRGAELIEHIRTADQPDWQLLRRAQKFSVSLYDRDRDRMLEATTITPYFDQQLWVLNNPEAYDLLLGLKNDAVGLGAEWLASW